VISILEIAAIIMEEFGCIYAQNASIRLYFYFFAYKAKLLVFHAKNL